MKLSFGMIFSIILIILFLIVGFFAIQKFLKFQDQAQVIDFHQYLGKEIDKVFKSTSSSSLIESNLPKNVKMVCVKESSSGTIVGLYGDYIGSYTSGGSDYRIDLYGEKTYSKLGHTNPEKCVKPVNGKVRFYIEKNYGDELPSVKLP